MTYLFTNPQVKKWKTLFVLSFCLNLILIAIIVYTVKSGENDRKEETQPVQTASDNAEAGEQQAAAAEQEGVQPAEPEKPEKELKSYNETGI